MHTFELPPRTAHEHDSTVPLHGLLFTAPEGSLCACFIQWCTQPRLELRPAPCRQRCAAHGSSMAAAAMAANASMHMESLISGQCYATQSIRQW